MGFKARRTLKEWDGYVTIYVGRVRASDEIGALKAVSRRADRQLRWKADPGQWQMASIGGANAIPILDTRVAEVDD